MSQGGNRKKRNIVIAVGIGVAAVIIAIVAGIAYQSSNQTAITPVATNGERMVYSPDAEPYGKSYGQWTAEWWKWAYTIPPEVSPLDDPTGENCHQGQDGPVWYLAGTFGGKAERKCTIPPDKSILIPVINVECSYAAYPGLRTPEELVQCAKADQDMVIEKEAIIDGNRVEDLDRYRIAHSISDITFPENNIAGVEGGKTQFASDGYWVFLRPLPPGEYEIHVKGAIGEFATTSTITFGTEVIYHISVPQA